jgi:hypothetical protein
VAATTPAPATTTTTPAPAPPAPSPPPAAKSTSNEPQDVGKSIKKGDVDSILDQVPQGLRKKFGF